LLTLQLSIYELVTSALTATSSRAAPPGTSCAVGEAITTTSTVAVAVDAPQVLLRQSYSL